MKFFSYINGVSYVFEGFMVNEFTYSMPCSPAQIVPFNTPQDAAHQSCAFTGNQAGQLSVQGSDYLSTAFGYSHSHLWRNVGVVIAFSILYLIPTIIASEFLPFAGGGGGTTLFAPTKRARNSVKEAEARADDPEANAVAVEKPGTASSSSNSDRTAQVAVEDRQTTKEFDEKPVFTWRNVHYTIDGHHLLNDIDGFVKPGEMTVCGIALLGAVCL